MKHRLQAPDDGAGSGGGSAAAGAGSGAAAAGAGGAASGAGSGGGAAAGAGAAGAGSSAAAGGGAGAGGTGSGAGAGAAGGAAAGAGAGAAGAAGGGTGAAGDSGAAAGAGGAAAPSWDADHWRTTWAGADDKKKAWAERRTDLKVALDSAYSADQKIAELSATAKTVLPKDATAEQITAYRKDNGIPEKPEAYLDALPKEVAATLSDDDKTIITPYLTALHKLNLTPAQASELIAVRQAEQDRQVESRVTADAKLRTTTEDALRGDWGNNYRAEINNIHGMLNGAPADVKEALLQARTPDGNALVGTPEVVRWLAQLARTVNPYSAPVGGDGGSLDQKGVDARITELEGWMGAPKGSENYRRYYDDSKAQTEYRNLVDAREAMKKRTAA